MSTREKVYDLIDNFTDAELEQVLTMLTSVKKIIVEASDDAYCEKLLKDYLDDPSDDKHESISLEKMAEELGIELNEI